MPDSHPAPPASSADASAQPPADAASAPVRETGSSPPPPASAAPPPASAAPAPTSVAPTPTATPAPSTAIPPALIHTFLGLKATQARIRQVALHRLGGKKAPPDRVDEVVQATSEKALTTPSLPAAPEQLRPWISAIARSVAIDSLRRQAVHDARFGSAIDVEELPPDPIDAPDDEEASASASAEAGDPTGVEWTGERSPAKPEPFLIGPWLEGEIQKSRGNREQGRMVLEMLRYKARHPALTDAQVAATFGLTLAAYESRYRRFRQRYVPLRRRYVERRNAVLLLLLLFGGAVALLVGLLRPRPTLVIAPDPAALPIPSASASASAAPFNQAASTPRGEVLPMVPTREKP